MIEVLLETGLAPAIDAAASAAGSACGFLRQAWFAAAGTEAPLTLLAARPGRNIAAALPTASIGPRLLGLRAVPGSYWPFRSFPVADDLSDDELASMLASPEARRALGRCWRLGPVPADDPAAGAAIRVARRCGYVPLSRSVGATFVLEIAEGWPRASTQRNLHKHEKRLARLGALDCRFVGGARGWTREAFDQLRAIERNSWAGSRSDADPKFVGSALDWEAMAGDPVLAGMMSAGILSIAGDPVAFSFGVDCGPVRYCIATSYDQRFARHSPGYFINYRTYIDAAGRGIERLDLGTGDGGEKRSMGAVPGTELHDHLFVRGQAAALLLRRFWR